MRIVHYDENRAFPIKLEQYVNGKFKLTYGTEIHDSLTYAQAAHQLGFALMHSFTCEGKIEEGRL